MVNHSPLLALILLGLLSVVSPAGAQDIVVDEKIVVEDTEEKITVAPPALSPESLIKIESIGLISSIKQGALEKSIWKDQGRKETLHMMSLIPAEHGMVSLQTLKKNLLLSQTDVSLLKNDAPATPGDDLMMIRLRKLMESGFNKDALELYRSLGDEPYDEKLAELGIVMILHSGDMSTACLEEKVLTPRYPGKPFWATLDQACNITLGTPGSKTFAESAVLDSIYASPGFRIDALDQKTLMPLSGLERGILIAEKRIDFSKLAASPQGVAGLNPVLLSAYLASADLPETLRWPLMREGFVRGIVSYTDIRKADPDYKRIYELETPAEQWAALESMISTESSPAAIRHYAGMIALSKPDTITPALLVKALSVMAAAGETVPEYWSQTALRFGEKDPMNYVYLQALRAVGLLEKPVSLPDGGLARGLAAMSPHDAENFVYLIETLDSQSEVDHNPLQVYEKELGLTSDSNYVMPLDSLMEMMGTAEGKQHTGSVVLLTLQTLREKPEFIYPGTFRKVLNGLQNVGLIEESRKIGQEWLSGLLTQKQGE